MADLEDSNIAVPAPQCQFFVVRKKRLCRMTVRPGRQYCGEHEPQPPTEDQENDKRVPCPNDPKHTCYISKLEKHLTKCNARKKEEPSYIEYNINAPEDAETCPRIPLRDVPEEVLARVIHKVNTLYDKYLKDNISTFNPQEEYHIAVQDDILAEGRTDSSRRHLRQASRLMLLAEEEDLVHDNTCYVELGAGKGMVSYYMARAWCGGGSAVVAVDRAALRHKRDNRVRAACGRLRADLQHLALHRAPAVRARPALLALAKHLCGAATDYALRSVCAAGTARGAVVAACCHHRCDARAYLGAAPLQELGITSEELNVMFGIVSWATCGSGRSRQYRQKAPTPAPTPIGVADYTFRRISEEGTTEASEPREGGAPEGSREQVGRRAKALLEHGRVLYLRGQGFQARLCYYVPITESPENICIIAKKPVL